VSQKLDRERILVLDHRSGRGKASGLELGPGAYAGVHIFHVGDGKVTRLVGYPAWRSVWTLKTPSKP
jgi:hypothetical protein